MELESLVSALAPRLLRYCAGRTGDFHNAEEVAQEALTALVRRYRQGAPPETPEAFVFAIARRRAWRVRLKQRLFAPLSALSHAAAEGSSPEELMLAKSELVALTRALARLSRPQREALLLVAGSGLDRRTAAGILGISEAGLKMRLHRGRRRLSEMLDTDARTRRGLEEPSRDRRGRLIGAALAAGLVLALAVLTLPARRQPEPESGRPAAIRLSGFGEAVVVTFETAITRPHPPVQEERGSILILARAPAAGTDFHSLKKGDTP